MSHLLYSRMNLLIPLAQVVNPQFQILKKMTIRVLITHHHHLFLTVVMNSIFRILSVKILIDEDISDKLFESSHISLYQTLAMLFSWFTTYPSISKEAFSRLLYLLKMYVLPQPNNLPVSYHKALSFVRNQLVPLRDFHCCVNDCVIFRSCAKGDYSNMSTCPVCGEARYKNQSREPRKRYKYIPLAPRFKRMFGSRTISKLLQNHQDVQVGDTISDLHQTQLWKTNYSSTGIFQGDPRGLSLALCTDGMNPFAKQKVTYSMWPVNVSILNLPHRYRTSAASMLLVGIIPGKAEAKSLNPYLDILVEELERMEGMEIYDGHNQNTFSLKARIILSVLDYPGHNKVFQCHGKCKGNLDEATLIK